MRRHVPKDGTVALRLALACLRDGDSSAAAALFAAVTNDHDVADAWLGLAAGSLQTGEIARAVQAMQTCLSTHAGTETAWQLADAVIAVAGHPGWCSVDVRGRLHSSVSADAVLDGVPLALRWTNGTAAIRPGAKLALTLAGVPLLGSPIDLTAIGAVEGFVEAHAGGVSGWAWHPGNPARDPDIIISGTTEIKRTLRTVRERNDDLRPLARPRVFTIAAADLPVGMLRVRGTDGRDLLGSPVDPGLERRAAAGIEPERWAPVWADVQAPFNTTLPVSRPVDVVVPVYGAVGRNPAQTLACLDSVLASLPRGSRLHVVDDCSPDPVLVGALQVLSRRGKIRLSRQPINRGYPAAVNAGMLAAAGRDVVLLNSDTLTPPGWLQALTAAARSAPDIGTACPLSNAATILSYPSPSGNAMPDLAGTIAQAAEAAAANGTAVIDIPVAVGFCMFIRRECLDQVGVFREDVFAQGYGEENDFCLRARHLGWRHVAAAGAFVAHAGGASFGNAQLHLQRRNASVLGRLHPGYDAMIAAWIDRDPLGPARLRMDAIHWRAGRRKTSVVLVTHAGGGGVDRVVADRCDALERVGIRPIVLRPDATCVTIDGAPNLRFRVPQAMPALARLLRAEHPLHVELHHLLGHDPALLDLAQILNVPHEVYVHDYAWFCPRIALVQDHSYCGEPPVSGCEACVADYGRNIKDPIPVAALVARSAQILGSARRVAAPGADVAARLLRHFPKLRAEVTPWTDDASIKPPCLPGAISRICIVGGIGVEKGYEVLLACVRDADRRGLALNFTVVGHTKDDDRLLAAGPVEITGRYDPTEVETLIRAQQADIAFLPSVWPETWCFTLGDAWRAGLRAAVFDLGTPAERVRHTGWGWVLPLGLPPPAVNDWLLRLDATQKKHIIAQKQQLGVIFPSSRQRNAVI